VTTFVTLLVVSGIAQPAAAGLDGGTAPWFARPVDRLYAERRIAEGENANESDANPQ